MSRFKLYFIFIPVIYLFTATSHSKERVNIVFVNLPMVLSHDSTKKGSYNHIFEQLHRNLINKPQTYFMPAKRAYMSFDKGLFDCIFPIDNQIAPIKEKLLMSKPLGDARAYIYTLSSDPIIADINQLSGKVIGARRGFDYGGYQFPSSVKLVEVESIEQNLIMLSRGRLDAFVAYEPDAISIFEENRDISIHRAETFSINTAFDQIACYESQKARDYIEQIDSSKVFRYEEQQGSK